MSESLLIKHDPVYNFQSIKNAYDEVNKKYPLSLTLRQIGAGLLNGFTELYMSNDTILVVSQDVDEENDKGVLFIILSYSVNGDPIEINMQQVITLAKSLDCQSIQWKSSKMYSKVEGANVKEWLYEIEI
jgi:hypothetical protein